MLPFVKQQAETASTTASRKTLTQEATISVGIAPRRPELAFLNRKMGNDSAVDLTYVISASFDCFAGPDGNAQQINTFNRGDEARIFTILIGTRYRCKKSLFFLSIRLLTNLSKQLHFTFPAALLSQPTSLPLPYPAPNIIRKTRQNAYPSSYFYESQRPLQLEG